MVGSFLPTSLVDIFFDGNRVFGKKTRERILNGGVLGSKENLVTKGSRNGAFSPLGCDSFLDGSAVFFSLFSASPSLSQWVKIGKPKKVAKKSLGSGSHETGLVSLFNVMFISYLDLSL